MADKKIINEEELLDIVGGYIFENKVAGRWQVINDKTGAVEYESSFLSCVEWTADYLGFSTEHIKWDKVEELKNAYEASKKQE
ncbi:MAG: hypothetical protein IKF80_03080 [Erysipelotrichaceae bacterium]|nr:hypothetical protein [Erysipelotrichaceae bacterium]